MLKRWDEDRKYCCRSCGGFPRLEKSGEHRWGCITCDTLTFNPDANFMPCIRSVA
jgi:hypothetical protein